MLQRPKYDDGREDQPAEKDGEKHHPILSEPHYFDFVFHQRSPIIGRYRPQSPFLGQHRGRLREQRPMPKLDLIRFFSKDLNIAPSHRRPKTLDDIIGLQSGAF